MKNTCEGCTERNPGCHDRCERYQAALTEHIAKKKWLKRYTSSLVTEPHIQRIRKRFGQR